MRIDDFGERLRPVGVFYVDVHPARWREDGSLEFLLLRRLSTDAAVPMPGEWQTVSGKLVQGERISDAFARQVHAKTGSWPSQLFKFRNVAQFYDDNYDTVMLVPNAVAIMPPGPVELDETLHDQFVWLPLADALETLIYPTQRWAVETAAKLLSLGDDGKTYAREGQVELTALA
ncbi:NUDIX domain-containing protein [Rothia sp. CCM 9417]|uniref:NUDIX domain-containing protein n=1 Tax=unclassified Rothia (in: high G+C Gram-positive bacteria) TaxID=2689056 RepID=UPI003AE19C6D